MPTASELRARAERYRRVARMISDPRAVQALNDLAELYEDMAAELDGASARQTDGQAESEADG